MMNLEKVRILNRKQLLEKLEQNGFELVANILSDRDINGEKLLDLTEFETIKWRLPTSQKKLLFGFIHKLKENPSIILKNHITATTKPKYEFPKASHPKPSRNPQKQPPSSISKQNTSYSSEDKDKIIFKQKLGSLFGGPSDFKPVLSNKFPTPPRFKNSDDIQKKAAHPDPAVLGNPVHASDGISAPSRFKKIDDNQQKASYADFPRDRVPATKNLDNESKLPFPLPPPPSPPIESRIPARTPSPSKPSNVKNRRELPSPVEPQKSRTMEYKQKHPIPIPVETQATKPSRSIISTGSKVKLPLPSSVKPDIAQRKPALLPPKEWKNTQSPPQQNIPKPREEDTYVDMGRQGDINYGYLTPNDIATARNRPPSLGLPINRSFLPPRNAFPSFQSHGADVEEPTYHDPEEMYELAPKLNLFDDASKVASVINQKPPPLLTRSIDNSNINTETKSRNLDPQNEVTIDGNEDKQGTGFLKKLLKIKGKLLYENLEIKKNVEHRSSVSEKIQPRPLPPLPIQDAPPTREKIPIGEPAGYIELTLQPPESEELYVNYNEKGERELLEECEEVNYSNTLELRSGTHIFPTPLSSDNYQFKNSTDDLAAKLARDLKVRHNEAQSVEIDEIDFEIDPEEDEEISEQTYSNIPVKDSVDNKQNWQQKQVNEAATKRSNQHIFPDNSNKVLSSNIWQARPFPSLPAQINKIDTAENRKRGGLNYSSLNVTPVKQNSTPKVEDKEDKVNEQLDGEIYENTKDISSNIWQARPFPSLPAQINKIETTENRKRGGFNYNGQNFTPVIQNSTLEVEDKDSNDQIYGNIEAEKSHPEKSQEDSIFNISNEPYYRYTDRKGAKQLLRTLKNGAFLFRPSERHFLVLTTKHNNKFYNFGIERSSTGKIRLTSDTNSDVPEFSSLQEFVDYFSKEALTFQEEAALAEIYLNPVLPHDAF